MIKSCCALGLCKLTSTHTGRFRASSNHFGLHQHLSARCATQRCASCEVVVDPPDGKRILCHSFHGASNTAPKGNPGNGELNELNYGSWDPFRVLKNAMDTAFTLKELLRKSPEPQGTKPLYPADQTGIPKMGMSAQHDKSHQPNWGPNWRMHFFTAIDSILFHCFTQTWTTKMLIMLLSLLKWRIRTLCKPVSAKRPPCLQQLPLVGVGNNPPIQTGLNPKYDPKSQISKILYIPISQYQNLNLFKYPNIIQYPNREFPSNIIQFWQSIRKKQAVGHQGLSAFDLSRYLKRSAIPSVWQRPGNPDIKYPPWRAWNLGTWEFGSKQPFCCGVRI